MYLECKMKKICFKIAALLLIWGLLCPNTIWAEELFYEMKEQPDKPTLVTFTEYEELKEREEELLAQHEEIASEKVLSEDVGTMSIDSTPIEETPPPPTSTIETSEYLITKSSYSDSHEKLEILQKDDSETKELEIEYFKDEKNNITEITAELKESDSELLVYKSSCSSSSKDIEEESEEMVDKLNEEAKIRGLATAVKNIISNFNRMITASIMDTINEPMTSNSAPNHVFIDDGNIGDPDISRMDEDLNNLFAFFDNAPADNPTKESKTADEVKSDDFTAMFEESGVHDDRTETTRVIKKEIYNLIKARNLAMELFYKDTAPYYNILASALEKAHWLWLKLGIDPHFYFAGADGVVDNEELRKMVEEAVAYLYENIPDNPEAQNLREEIIKLEGELRSEYIEPALELFKQSIKDASLEFYNSVEKEVKVLMHPIINNVDGELEVIIILPKESTE